MRRESLWPAIRSFLRAEGGPTAVEYAVLLALLVCACLAALLALGPAAAGTFSASTSSIGTYGVE